MVSVSTSGRLRWPVSSQCRSSTTKIDGCDTATARASRRAVSSNRIRRAAAGGRCGAVGTGRLRKSSTSGGSCRRLWRSRMARTRPDAASFDDPSSMPKNVRNRSRIGRSGVARPYPVARASRTGSPFARQFRELEDQTAFAAARFADDPDDGRIAGARFAKGGIERLDFRAPADEWAELLSATELLAGDRGTNAAESIDRDGLGNAAQLALAHGFGIDDPGRGLHGCGRYRHSKSCASCSRRAAIWTVLPIASYCSDTSVESARTTTSPVLMPIRIGGASSIFRIFDHGEGRATRPDSVILLRDRHPDLSMTPSPCSLFTVPSNRATALSPS